VKSQWDRFDRGSRAGIASAPAVSFRPGGAQIPRPCCREFTTIKRRERLLEEFLKRSMVVLLMIGGKCSCVRAKPAHFSGHLPTDEERRLIIEQGNKQLLESGKVVRTKIKKALGWNSDGYEKIKIVCDELGWHKDMQPQRISTEQKQVMKQEVGVCAMCGSTDNLEVDHIWPQSLGGNSERGNLQILCKSCNQKKGANV